MRELTRSLGRFSWAMSLFGFKQLANMMMPPDSSMEPASPQRAPDALDAMSRTVEGQLGDTFHQAFTTGDRLLSTVVDAMFGLGTNSRAWMDPQMGSQSDPLGDWGPLGNPSAHSDWGAASHTESHGSSPFDSPYPFDAQPPFDTQHHDGHWPGHPSSAAPQSHGMPASNGMPASPRDTHGPSPSPQTLDEIGGWGPMPTAAPDSHGSPHGSFAAAPSASPESSVPPAAVGGWGPMPQTPSIHS